MARTASPNGNGLWLGNAKRHFRGKSLGQKKREKDRGFSKCKGIGNPPKARTGGRGSNTRKKREQRCRKMEEREKKK